MRMSDLEVGPTPDSRNASNIDRVSHVLMSDLEVRSTPDLRGTYGEGIRREAVTWRFARTMP